MRPSAVPPTVRPRSIVQSLPDPYARTVRRDEHDDFSEASPPAPISPLAASVMATKGSIPPAPAAASEAPQHGTSQAPSALPQPQPQASSPAQIQAQRFHVFAPGTLVLVSWADGNRYPGTVLQISSHHVFVAFPNGLQQWIDANYVTAGG